MLKRYAAYKNTVNGYVHVGDFATEDAAEAAAGAGGRVGPTQSWS